MDVFSPAHKVGCQFLFYKLSQTRRILKLETSNFGSDLLIYENYQYKNEYGSNTLKWGFYKNSEKFALSSADSLRK